MPCKKKRRKRAKTRNNQALKILGDTATLAIGTAAAVHISTVAIKALKS